MVNFAIYIRTCVHAVSREVERNVLEVAEFAEKRHIFSSYVVTGTMAEAAAAGGGDSGGEGGGGGGRGLGGGGDDIAVCRLASHSL